MLCSGLEELDLSSLQRIDQDLFKSVAGLVTLKKFSIRACAIPGYTQFVSHCGSGSRFPCAARRRVALSGSVSCRLCSGGT